MFYIQNWLHHIFQTLEYEQQSIIRLIALLIEKKQNFLSTIKILSETIEYISI